jgi:hypothetical protein
LITTTTKQMSEWAVDAGLVVERLRLAQQDMEFHLGRCAMPREIFAEYKGRQIAVTVIPRVDGQFRIERVGVWSYEGKRTGYTKLTVAADLVFVTRAEAESYGFAFGQGAIDGGRA